MTYFFLVVETSVVLVALQVGLLPSRGIAGGAGESRQPNRPKPSVEEWQAVAERAPRGLRHCPSPHPNRPRSELECWALGLLANS